MKNGFTLIELLAVITILAIILLIALPVMTSIISNAKEKTNEDSVNLYGKAIENAINDYYVKYPLENEVTIKQLEDGGFLNLKGNKVECDTVRIIDRDVYLANCKVGNKYVDATYGENLGKLVDDADKDGKISRGDKYTYKVNNEDKFNFYVLGENADGTVNLIMDRNICEDGTTDYTENNNYCNYAWYSNGSENTINNTNTNKFGPLIGMGKLYNGTKDWIYVPNMNLEYNDITDQVNAGYTGETTYGYGGVNIVDGIGKITTKDGTEQVIQLTDNKPIKARLVKYSEVYGTGGNYCTVEDGTCPYWLIDNLHDSSYYAQYPDKVNMNNNFNYWLLASYPGTPDGSWSVYYGGKVSYGNTLDNSHVGIRPVITVPKENLMN